MAIGCNAADAADFPDCRGGFLELLDEAMQTSCGLRVIAPLVKLSKREVVTRAAELGIDPGETWSCYRDGVKPCGECLSCKLLAEASS